MSNTFQFQVPQGVHAGQKIRVNTPDGRQVDVTLPPNVFPGQMMTVNLGNMAPPTNPYMPMAPMQQPQSLMKIVVPAGVGGGQLIAVRAPDGRQVNVTLPPGTMPGQQVIVDINAGIVIGSNLPQPPQATEIEVVIPAGVSPGQLLAVRSPTGQQVNVPVPANADPGDKIVVNMTTGAIIRHEPAIPEATPVGETDKPAASHPPQHQKQQPQYPSFFDFRGYPYQPIPLTSRIASIMPAPKPSGRKKALLIGINYPGTKAALRGCINDVVMMRDFLLKQGFENSPYTMVCLVDNTQDPRFMPTKANIIKGIQWLIAGAAPGDTLFFHFSGHGAQETDNSGREADGLNETLCPCDFNRRGVGMISDDMLWDMLCAPLPNGCRLYAVLDCCHSGTGLDLPYTLSGRGWAKAPNPNFCEGDVIMFSGCKENQTSADAWSHDMNAPGGAMTTSFINCHLRDPNASLSQFVVSLQQDIRLRGFTQIPQLAASQKWRATDRKLDFHDGIVGNGCEHWGKFKNQHFQPQRANMGNSPLGPMLMAAGFAVLVAPELMGGRRASDSLFGMIDNMFNF